MDHELPESPESIANAIHPHSCYLCNSCSTYTSRKIWWNTNITNYTNLSQTPFIRIRVICVIRVQHIPRGKFDGTRISRITRIFRNRHSSAFVLFVQFVFNIYHAKKFDWTRITRIARIFRKRHSSAFVLFVQFVFNIYHAKKFDWTRITRIARIFRKRHSSTFVLFV